MDLTKTIGKSAWKERQSDVWKFYCPLCKGARRVPFASRPQTRHYIQVALTALVFMLATWKWFAWKGLVSFIPMWTGFEVFYRVRMRGALPCSGCGFDPYLYLNDVQKARTEVQNHWKKKFEEMGIPFPDKKSSQPLTDIAPQR